LYYALFVLSFGYCRYFIHKDNKHNKDKGERRVYKIQEFVLLDVIYNNTLKKE